MNLISSELFHFQQFVSVDLFDDDGEYIQYIKRKSFLETIASKTKSTSLYTLPPIIYFINFLKKYPFHLMYKYHIKSLIWFKGSNDSSLFFIFISLKVIV